MHSINNGFATWIQRWLPVIALLLMGIAAWMTVRIQVENALPRVEAYQTFWTIDNQRSWEEDTKAWRRRVDDKLDRILERK